MSLYEIEDIKTAFPQFADFALRAESENGAVCSVWDPRQGFHVALKLSRENNNLPEEMRERFDREYYILRTNYHPALVQVYGDKGKVLLTMKNGDRINHFWYTMELCDSDVKTMLPHLPLRHRMEIIDQFLAGLSYLHSKDIAHRDIKPQNLFLVVDPDPVGLPGETDLHTAPTLLLRGRFAAPFRVKIGDFGIAKDGRSQSSLVTRCIMGTGYYLAPERFVIDTSPDRDWKPSDQYAAGATLYEILSQGRLPLDFPSAIGRNILETYRAGHERGDVRALEVPERRLPVPEGSFEKFPQIDQVIRRMMAKDPSDRYPSIADCHRSLRVALAQSNL